MRTINATLLGIILVLAMASGAFALEVPPYKGRVNDLANMMSSSTEQALEAQLAELEKTDSTQVSILTIPSLEGDSLEDFSIRVADAWKVGQKNSDNGVILLVSKADRKSRIEVGYGLEGVLTDVLAGQILNNVIAPRFKQGNFDAGFKDGVIAITSAVRGEFAASKSLKRKSKINIFSIIVVPMILIIMFTEKFGRARRQGQMTEGQTLEGAQGQGRGSTAANLLLLSMLAGGSHRGGGGGFGGGGGGFGGFGGGGFGGGGASGGW
ncbi:TPM domain-containing protein [uncultured Pseudodesulfovibrio sp.]|uniref:TPM domain-containing protein n=1 Tax=uncultured Pseudodesulfovibrio sp. TaxID=2035858 RepID=UPI0029C70827|nr:TPM domain-containing protein [uncultured Pseudodesulfovibrio sp.]